MVKIREAIVVEGRYDKNTLSQIVDAPIIQTNGFGIMNDKKLLELLRKIAKTRGLIVFTDSDGAGFVIRNYLKSAIPASELKHAYIPDVPGKEKRKSTPSKEGKLGVEGMTSDVILQSLERAGATLEGETEKPSYSITKQDLVELGLSGRPDASGRRKALLTHLSFPEHMSTNAMLQSLQLLYSLDELKEIVTKVTEKVE